ncbi:MAG: MBL fold metallo-hydrolase [Deltaproteobacteria bacterium]|nr:MBL fold metallo-hydrolase [Deltaproteobacteria bacterium]
MTTVGETLGNRVWQPLPGCLHGEIYPYLRKPDLLSANACLIRTKEQLLLIDPGALEEQTRDLCAAIRLCEAEQSRPLLIYLTHCHIDHVLSAPACRQANWGAPAWIAVHEEGARTLTQGDEKRSMAEIYGVPFPPFAPDLLLLTQRDRESPVPRQVRLSPTRTLTLKTEGLPTGDGRLLYRQRIPIGEGEHLFLYPAPGHSPDGLCIQIGEILFIGDLLAAVNPMIAGIAGWNRDDYLLTLEQVLWLLENGGISQCVPGHGGILGARDVKESFRRLIREARQLGELEEVNRERTLFTAECARELIDEAEEIFSAIAGRLGYLSHQLEILEEPEAAADCRALMDMDGIDDGLAGFRRLCGEVEQGKLLQIKFVLAALGSVKKIRQLFDRRRLEDVIQPSLLNRADRLLIDFIGVARGVRNPEEFVWTDLQQAVREIVGELRESPHTDRSFIDASGCREDYLAALTARIGYADLFEKTALEVSDAGPLPPVRLAQARFADTLTHLLEFLAVRGASGLALQVGMDREVPSLRIVARGAGLAPGIEARKIHSFGTRFRMSGAAAFQAEGTVFDILLPAG